MANPPPVNIFQAVADDAKLTAIVNNARQHLGLDTVQPPPTGFFDDATLDVDLLKGLVLTHFISNAEIEDQNVRVEYLRRDERMLLPAALNAALDNPDAGEEIGPLIIRYWKITTFTYAQLKALVDAKTTFSEIRVAVDGKVTPAMTRTTEKKYDYEGWYTTADGKIDDFANIILTFSYISCALGFNCDLRDLGLLNTEDMRMSDVYWQNKEAHTIDRLSSKLQVYTLQCIAALNLDAVAKAPMAAWTRAFGVSCGVLPTPDSQYIREYDFVATRPSRDLFLAVCTFEQKNHKTLKSNCLNLISMFGLLHLEKDRTFKTNDNNMQRICAEYLSTVRTMVSDALMDEMNTQLEPLCRTAQHPFGLAQTYAVALLMNSGKRLAKPLGVRTRVTPPPVQRLMIVKRAISEWSNLVVGREINEMYKAEIALVRQEIAKIAASPPSYSELSRLFGIPKSKTISEESKAAVETMMPMIYGFAMSQHCDELGNKDGIALALSLENVAREHRMLAERYVVMWDQYLDGMLQNDGLLKNARDAKDM